MFSYISVYSPVQGTVIDAMHGLFLGLEKRLIELLFSDTFKQSHFSQHQNAERVSARLRSIKPPRSVKRVPRSLNQMQHFKASEFAMILIMYQPILLGLIPDAYLKHLCHLSNVSYLLYKSTVTQQDLETARYSIKRFCEQFETLYGLKYQTSNFHNLTHIVDDVASFGPLWNTDCFAYENASGDMMRHIFGTQAPDQQVIRAISVTHKLPHIVDDITNAYASEFAQRMLSSKWAAKETQLRDTDFFVLGSLTKSFDQDEQQFVQTKVLPLIGVVPTSFKVTGSFVRFRKHTRVYHCQNYTKAKKRNSFTVQFKDGNGVLQYGMLKQAYSATYTTGDGKESYIHVAHVKCLRIISPELGHAKHISIVAVPKEGDEDLFVELKDM